MKGARKRKHSPATVAASASSSGVAETKRDAQKKPRKQSPCTGSGKNIKKEASVQDPSTSGEGRPHSVDTSTGYECAICLESTSRKEMRTLQCSHAFHQACIDMWLTENTECPVCRQETAPPQNAIPPSNNQRQAYLEQLQALPGMRTGPITVRFNNGGVDMRFNNGGVDMRFDDGGFIRLNDGGFDMRLNNGRIEMMFNSGGVSMRRENRVTHVRLDNGGFMNLMGTLEVNNINI
ncbi:hypothetical protein AVEN_219482-1 [Araneus ventricosus]|uniref:RING-type domain-containing protein n=1 Tax=Araneus ventricosus TaxID=182803 RepID=A0A4Y2BMQ7_ARAVE|nr:hypothetical protein AVEN_219482-1 [Araneus ventricosus]